MNLRDRMSSGPQAQEPTEITNTLGIPEQPISNDTMQRSNPQLQESIVQKQSETIQRQADEIKELSDTVQSLQAHLDQVVPEWELLKDQGRPEDMETIQQLSSEISELRSAIADLRAELLSVQRINLSLTKRNDDLRNNAGLLSRKEQEKLEEELTAAQTLLADTRKKVDMSNVEAVEAALTAKKAAERKAEKDIAAYRASADRKISNTENASKEAIRQSKDKVKTAEKNTPIAQGSLLFTLLCCLFVHPVIIDDILSFITVPVLWAWDKVNEYAIWFEEPYHSEMVGGGEKFYAYSTGMAWLLRILSFILLLACFAGTSYALYELWEYYRKRWCTLSLRVLLASLASIIVFGEIIRKYVSINLVLLFVIMQLIYLGILVYLDGYFESRYRKEEWEKLQNE